MRKNSFASPQLHRQRGGFSWGIADALGRADPLNRYAMEEAMRERSDEYEISLLAPEDTSEALPVVCKVLSEGEVMTKCLKISYQEHLPVVQEILEGSARERKSFLARSRADGGIVGFVISEDLQRAAINAPDWDENAVRPFTRIWELMEDLDQEYGATRWGQGVEPGDVLHCYLLGSCAEERRSGIATSLVKATVELAQEDGYEAVIAEATSPASQKVFMRCGFASDEQLRRVYREWKGGTVFPNLDGDCRLVERAGLRAHPSAVPPSS
jgi:GNAT superfamily N-acetyltransferase